LPALWVSSQQVGECDALVRFFTPNLGAVTAKARGLLKPASKLAAALKPADELSISLAGKQTTKTLTGTSTVQEHSSWRTDLHYLALVWFMCEADYVGSGPPQLNEQIFQLTVNLLRSRPQPEALAGGASVFAIRLLTLHGLMPDLDHCVVDHCALNPGEPAFFLPNGEGFVSLGAYNRQFARSRAALLQLSAGRLARWRQLQRAPLLSYHSVQADIEDAAILCALLTRQLSNLANQPLESMKFLRRQWKLPRLSELMTAG